MKIIEYTGAELRSLERALSVKFDENVHTVRLADQGQGLIVKVNEGMWSASLSPTRSWFR